MQYPVATLQQIVSILRRNPSVFKHDLTNCAYLEHFINYRQIARNETETQLKNTASIESEPLALAASSAL